MGRCILTGQIQSICSAVLYIIYMCAANDKHYASFWGLVRIGRIELQFVRLPTAMCVTHYMLLYVCAIIIVIHITVRM